jgi:hypothetical protein
MESNTAQQLHSTSTEESPTQEQTLSTMDVLKERVDDLFNIFYNYSQCDPSIGTAKNMNGHYWREKDFTKFLREFRFLTLLGRRQCLELYHSHSSKHSNGEVRLSFDAFMWCMSSFAHVLPWGETSADRTTLLLHGLEEGLQIISKRRGPHRISSPSHRWLKKHKISISKRYR